MPLLSLLYFVFLFKIESSVIVHNSTWPLLIVKQLLQHFVILYIYIKLVWVPHLYFIISLCNVHQFFLNFCSFWWLFSWDCHVFIIGYFWCHFSEWRLTKIVIFSQKQSIPYCCSYWHLVHHNIQVERSGGSSGQPDIRR